MLRIHHPPLFLILIFSTFFFSSQSHVITVYMMLFTSNHLIKEAISAREQTLCQLTVCFEFQSRSDKKKRAQKLCPGNGVQKESKKVTVKV